MERLFTKARKPYQRKPPDEHKYKLTYFNKILCKSCESYYTYESDFKNAMKMMNGNAYCEFQKAEVRVPKTKCSRHMVYVPYVEQ